MSSVGVAVSTEEAEKMIEEDVSLLTQRMRKATKEVHNKSDRLVNLKLSVVLTSKRLYAEAISLFWPIYEEIETILKTTENEQLKLFRPILSQMMRGERFRKDIRALIQDEKIEAELFLRRNPKQGVYAPVELQSYIDRLHELAQDNPIGLVAYIYHMYMAIFAGGAVIRRMVKRTYSLKTEEGVQIFGLETESNIKVFRNNFKDLINHKMDLSDKDVEFILRESSEVFRRNNRLVSTVQDTTAFANAQKICMRYLFGIVAALFVAILAIWLS